MSRWYKRCGADFIHGTMMLTLEEKGAYSLCLDLIYDRGGPIPDDARWLSGVCGVSMRKWTALRARLLELGKLTAENGLLTNVRARFELVSMELQARERAEAGAKGGRKRAENAGERHQSNDLGQAKPKRIEENREEENKAPNGALPRKRGTRLAEDFEMPPEWKVWALVRGMLPTLVDSEAESFTRYWQAKAGRDATKMDWEKTWQNWITRASRDGRHGHRATDNLSSTERALNSALADEEPHAGGA